MTERPMPPPSPRWAQGIRLLLVVAFVLVCATGIVDSARAFRTKAILSDAAAQAAQIVSANPLTVTNCNQASPCPIVWAATAAKASLTRSGFSKARCIDPQRPTSSGVLVWTFSCDAGASCPTEPDKNTVCFKVDMTATSRGSIPSTEVTVQYPHTWASNAVLSWFGRSLRMYPENISVSVVRPATAASGRTGVGNGPNAVRQAAQNTPENLAVWGHHLQPPSTEKSL